ncbi:MAG: DUF1980 domain-containing protein, partial [Microbacteriaceae bacterium]|nr:DUF1980 domain-containing protein [Microbacteriaceae bacterium]
MASRFLHRWRGVLLSLIGIVAVIWLAFTDQLGLYIHPRYFIFTVIMAVIAGVFVLLAFLLPSQAGSGQHEHETPPRGAWVWVPANIVLIAVTA